jgi:hypothetical protein
VDYSKAVFDQNFKNIPLFLNNMEKSDVMQNLKRALKNLRNYDLNK